MNDAIDIYCERLGPGFWAEPVNAATNISFILAALFAFLLAKRENALDWRAGLLIVLLLCIGAGSFTFHTFATGWAELADVLPILFFQLAFIALYALRVIGLSTLKTTGLIILFFLTAHVFGFAPASLLNGSLMYAPAFLFLGGFALWHARNAARERWSLPLACGIFLVSLSLRSLDMQICEKWPLGLHFMWHLLNGLMLYFVTRSYLKNARK